MVEAILTEGLHHAFFHSHQFLGNDICLISSNKLGFFVILQYTDKVCTFKDYLKLKQE